MQGVHVVQLTVFIICCMNGVLLFLYAINLLYAKKTMAKALQCLKMLPSPVIINYDEIEVIFRKYRR